MKYIFIGLIKLYRLLISPMLRNRCRFYPSCSAYGLEAFKTWGTFKGGYLTIKRILKCNPLHDGGVDLVPKKPDAKGKS